MTRKDFELIAEVLSAGNNLSNAKHVINVLALDFAHRLKATNPRFDVQRFVKACTATKS